MTQNVINTKILANMVQIKVVTNQAANIKQSLQTIKH